MSSELAEQFYNLFQGSDERFVVYRADSPNGTINGRPDSGMVVVERPVTVEDWEKHLNGEEKIGIIPARKTNDCKFGAIANGEGINVTTKGVISCQNLSREGNVFLFFKEFTGTDLSWAYLWRIATENGLAAARIYPTHVPEQEGIIDGNAVEMPYFGRPGHRYALTADNQRMEPAEFIRIANGLRLSKAELEKPVEASVGDTNERVLFSDGPPCLQRIMAFGRTYGAAERDTVLFNTSVYANHKWGGAANMDARDLFLRQVNALLSEPLSDDALADFLQKTRKDGKSDKYKYQCQKCPLKNYCDSAVCNQRTYGIKAYQGSCVRGLTKVDLNPAIWILSINEKRINLSTEQLCSHRLLRQRVLDGTTIMLNTMKESDWQDSLKEMLKEVKVIQNFEGANQRSEIIEKIHVWLYDWKYNKQMEEQDLQSVASGSVYHDKDDSQLLFVPDAIYTYMKADDKNGMKQKVNHILLECFHASEFIAKSLSPKRRCFSVHEIYADAPPDVKTNLEKEPY